MRVFYPCFLIVTMALFGLMGHLSPAFAGDLDGDYGMRKRVDGRNAELTYLLRLSPLSNDSVRRGNAELTIVRRGSLGDSDRVGKDYGSVATVYLKNRQRVVHRGTWMVFNNRLTITLTDIDGEKDRAVFTGTSVDGDRRLELQVNNTGMYGSNVSFRLDRDFRDNSDGDSADDFKGVYREEHERRINGRWVRIEYRLRLREGGDAEMEISTRDRPRTDSETGRYFGSIATVYLQDNRRLTHTGRWTANGNAVMVTLERIDGKRDNARFSGTLRRDTLDLECHNRGMYGEMRFRLERR